MVVLDTNVWFAYLNDEDFRHEKAVKIFSSLTDDILIPEYILSELCTLLVARKKKEIADSFIAMAESNDRVELMPSSPQFFMSVREEFKRIQSSKFSFIDISLLVLSQSFRVITFDASLYKLLKKK